MPPLLEFIEVNSSHEDLKENRRRIRSHAARAGNANDSTNEPRDLSKRNRNGRPIVWPLTVELTARVELTTTLHHNIPVRSRQEHVSETEGSYSMEPEQVVVPAARPVGDGYVLIPFVGNDTMLPISQSKLYPLPFLSVVLNNYLSHLAVAIPEIDGPDDTCLLKKSWFPMVLHSKVLFQIIMLFSASHYAFHQKDEVYSHDILLIKDCALRDLRDAMITTRWCYKDETIAAVAKMASYEAIFGTEQAYHIHMDAVERMLKRRGGLSTLGLNSFLSRLLVFIDTNSSFMLNTRLHLTESEFPRREPWSPPNPDRFLGSPELLS